METVPSAKTDSPVETADERKKRLAYARHKRYIERRGEEYKLWRREYMREYIRKYDKDRREELKALRAIVAALPKTK